MLAKKTFSSIYLECPCKGRSETYGTKRTFAMNQIIVMIRFASFYMQAWITLHSEKLLKK